eukprot:scaffold36288_cov113-Phaeocystis_antarctica.AAC.1
MNTSPPSVLPGVSSSSACRTAAMARRQCAAGRDDLRSGLPPAAKAESSPRSTVVVSTPQRVGGMATSSSQQPPARSSM